MLYFSIKEKLPDISASLDMIKLLKGRKVRIFFIMLLLAIIFIVVGYQVSNQRLRYAVA